MSKRNPDLHGAVPENSRLALLLIDFINDLEFPEGQKLLKYAEAVAVRIAQLKKRATATHVPIIYVDNFGRWKSDFQSQINHCLQDGVRGEKIATLLLPKEEDYFVLKPKHSGFYSTSLDILLDYLSVEVLIFCGFTGDRCVLHTAHDAYMRDFHIIVPRDCIASEIPSSNQQALKHMRKFLKAETPLSKTLCLQSLQTALVS